LRVADRGEAFFAVCLLIFLVFLTGFLAALRTGVFFPFRLALPATFLLVAIATLPERVLHFESSIVAE
jgi:hypothetical protein